MTLYYDNLVYSLQRYGGISTYWYELSSRLLSAPDVQIHFYETGHEQENICRTKLNISSSQIIPLNRGGLMLERFLKVPAVETPHIFHSSYFRLQKPNANTKTVTTVHDFIHDLYFSGPRVWLHNLMKRKAVLNSDVIITVSEHTKKDLLHFFPEISPDRVQVIYNGVSEGFKILEEKQTVEAPFFLYVGMRDNYKNFDFAVSLVASQPAYHLKIVGPTLQPKEQQQLDTVLPGRYQSMTAVEEHTLNELYNTAFCFLYPSAYEGFGIPILEAMKAGCPFIALNRSAVPEVAGNAGVLLNDTDLEEGWQAISHIQKNRDELINLGLQQASKFSWDACYEETRKLYKSL